MTTRFTTNEYVKLSSPLQLGDWSIRLTMAEPFGDLSPFKTWDPAQPTASLPWYSDYNSTKHDREANLNKATLESLVNAVGSSYVMLGAQLGPELSCRGTIFDT